MFQEKIQKNNIYMYWSWIESHENSSPIYIIPHLLYFIHFIDSLNNLGKGYCISLVSSSAVYFILNVTMV